MRHKNPEQMAEIMLYVNEYYMRNDRSPTIREIEANTSLSRSAAQKLCDAGAVLVNGAPVRKNHKVSAGDRISVTLPEPESTELTAQEIPLDWNKLAPGISEVRDFWNGKTEKCSERIALEPHSCKLWEF